MSRPPFDPRHRPAVEQPSWRGILVSYALIPVVFLSLWGISHPLTATVIIVATVCLLLTLRRTLNLARCLSNCGGFSIDLGGKIRITIARPQVDDSR